MTRDTRCSKEIAIGPDWRAFVDERKEKPGERAYTGVDARLRLPEGTVTVTASLCGACDPLQTVAALLEKALSKLRRSP
jgi:hypothetical protein